MTGEVDTTDFNAMCDELSDILRVPPDQVVRNEVGRVLSKTIENTEAADVDKIRRHSEQAKYSRQNGKLYNLSRHYPDKLWASIQLRRAIDLNKRIAARGLAKRSWYRIGQLLSVRVDAPAYVKKAIARTGKIYPEDERASIDKKDGSVSFTIENAQPTVNAINGEQALQSAIDGRTSYFVVNTMNGVFDDLSKAAKKYPGVTVHHG